MGQVRTMAVLGDSVPYGTACNCSPYPVLSGEEVAEATGHPVDVMNDAVPGAVSGDVKHQLTTTSVRAHVEESNLVLVEIGANDVSYSSACGTTVTCYEDKIPALAHNLSAIVDDIHDLVGPRWVTVVLLGYWNVWLGGQYAQEKGSAYVAAADALTASVNDAIASVARSTGSIYVNLRTAFRGPDDNWDETHLLAPDGDHPNAEGQDRIADAIAAALARAHY